MIDIFSIAKDKLDINNSMKFSNDKIAIFYYEEESIEYVSISRHGVARVKPKVVIVNNHINLTLGYNGEETESEYVDIKIITDDKNYNFKIYYNKIIDRGDMFSGIGKYTTSYFNFNTEE